MRPTLRTLGRRRASVRRRRAWTARYLAPARPCRGCGCEVRFHLAARTGAACSRGCGCLGLSTARRENGHHPRTPRRLRPDQVGGMREYLADLDRLIARVRRCLVASYAWVARREVREADLLPSLGNVAYERGYLAELLADRQRVRDLLAAA